MMEREPLLFRSFRIFIQAPKGGWWWTTIAMILAFIGWVVVAPSIGHLIALGSYASFAVIDLICSRPSIFRIKFVQFGVPIIGFWIASGLAPATVKSTEFYKASAGILPVLLLVFVVERRQDYRGLMYAERIMLVYLIGYIVLASYETLRVLASDDAAIG